MSFILKDGSDTMFHLTIIVIFERVCVICINSPAILHPLLKLLGDLFSAHKSKQEILPDAPPP